MSHSFAEMMSRLQRGDEDAATLIFNRFTNRLIGLAQVRLESRLRQVVDPEEILQSVYLSFFLRHTKGKRKLSDWDSLWGLLALITVQKCGRCARRFHAARRDVNREVAMAGSGKDSGDDAAMIDAFSDEPSPAEALMLSEMVEQLLRDLGPRNGEIFTLALQGYSAAEIGQKLNRPTSTVHHVLKRIEKRLKASSAEAEVRSQKPEVRSQ